MQVAEILTILGNRLITLQNLRVSAVLSGDLENVLKIDADIATTQQSIKQLETLQPLPEGPVS